MIEEIKNLKITKSDLRKFGITIGIILFAISGFLFWKGKSSFQLFFTIGTILFLGGIAIPFILKPIYWMWMIFAIILGWFMTRVILSLLFYVILSPIGLIARIFRKQFIELKWNKKHSTYWNYRSNGVPEKKQYEKQF